MYRYTQKIYIYILSVPLMRTPTLCIYFLYTRFMYIHIFYLYLYFNTRSAHIFCICSSYMPLTRNLYNLSPSVLMFL